MNHRITLALASVALLACRESPRRTCVESLCFEWAEAHETRSVEHKHKLTSPAWGGAWLDVQSWEPGPGAPSDVSSLQNALTRMRELTATARSSSMRAGTIGGLPAAVEDATIDWRGHSYRRVTWVVRRAPRWVAVDVTAPIADWERASPRVRAIVERATWEQPAAR